MKPFGIALGSGAARGLAHIGVLEALEEEGLRPASIAGTSMGALVGAVYGSGNLTSLKEEFLKLDRRNILFYFLELNMPRSGLIDGHRIVETLEDQFLTRRIEDLDCPFRCIATNLLTGKPYIFREGNLAQAVRASISIPGIFNPVYIEPDVLIDGGLVNPVPVDEVRDMGAKFVVGVEVTFGRLEKAEKSIPTNYLDRLREIQTDLRSETRQRWIDRIKEALTSVNPEQLGPIKKWLAPAPIPNMIDVLANSFRIMEDTLGDFLLKIHPADLLIRPDVSAIGTLEFDRADEAIAAGYEAMHAAMPQLQAALENG